MKAEVGREKRKESQKWEGDSKSDYECLFLCLFVFFVAVSFGTFQSDHAHAEPWAWHPARYGKWTGQL